MNQVTGRPIDTQWTDLLLQTALFKNIEKDQLLRMLTCLNSRIVTYRQKELVTLEKDHFSDIGIILDGEVAVIKENLAGDRIFMSKLKAGDIFGPGLGKRKRRDL